MPTQITHFFKDSSESELKLITHVDGIGLEQRSVFQEAFLKEDKTSDWRPVSMQAKKIDVKEMSVEEFLRTGRAEIFNFLSPGRLIQASHEAVEQAKKIVQAEIDEVHARMRTKAERKPVEFPQMVKGFVVSYEITPELEIDMEAYHKKRLGYSDEEYAEIANNQWFRLSIHASVPGATSPSGSTQIKACCAPNAVDYVTRDQAGGNLEGMIHIAVRNAQDALAANPNRSQDSHKNQRSSRSGLGM